MRNFALLVFALFLTTNLKGQEKKTGPAIKEFGPVWAVEEINFTTNTSAEYHAVFDVMHSLGPGKINPWMETAARFLNMHRQAGVPAENLKAVLVVHNEASTDLLTEAAHQDRFAMDNPNSELLRTLMDSGVRVVLCGQSSHSRAVKIEDTVDGVELALSAMTALIHFQNSGYSLIKF